MAEQPPVTPRRVLLIQLKRAGDVVVSTALLEDLHAAFPGVVCDWMVGYAGELLEHHPLIHRLALRDHRDLAGMTRDTRAGSYDLILDVQGSWRTAFATGISGAPARVGWRGWNRGWAYTHAVARAPRDSRTYVVADRRRLLHACGVPTGDAPPRLYLTDHERERGERRIRKLAGDRAVVGIVLSTANPIKDWAPENFAAVATALEADGVAAVVFSTPGGATQESAYRAAAGAAARVHPDSPLRGLMELIAACDVFLSGDTGPAHIASALGVPRVTIYGPTRAEGWTPPSAAAVAVRDTAARCLSCAGQAPPAAHSCMQTVTAQMVLAPVREMLASRNRGQE